MSLSNPSSEETSKITGEGSTDSPVPKKRLKIAETNNEGSSAEFIRNMRQVASIESLSDEVLESIFSYLALSDVHRRVAVVSKKWKAVSREKRFGPERVTLTNRNAAKSLGGHMINIGAVKNFYQTLRCVKIKESFFRSSEDIETLVELFQKCSNLQELLIRRCSFLDDFPIFFNLLSSLKVTLKKIEYADITSPNPNCKANNNWYISELLRFIADSNVEQLSLKLHSDVIYCHTGEGEEVLPTRLKKLDIEFFFRLSSPEFVRKLINANKNELVELKLRSNVFDEKFMAMVKECKNLKYFSLGNAKYFSYFDWFGRKNESPLKCDFVELEGLRLATIGDILSNSYNFFKYAKSLKLFIGLNTSQINLPIEPVQFDFPLLTELTFDHDTYQRLTENVALDIASNFPLLKILRFIECNELRYTIGQNALNMFPNLMKVIYMKPTWGSAFCVDTLREQLTNEISFQDYSWNVDKLLDKRRHVCFTIERKMPEAMY